jgi:uncharacterized protein involved in response to NO
MMTESGRLHARRRAEASRLDMLRNITFKDLGQEPFRVFFPAGVLAGVVGVALWPLYFSGIRALYPGQTHPRLMAGGFFCGFILGFLGTALPRMLSCRRFSTGEVGLLLLLHTGMMGAFALGKVLVGDVLFLLLLLGFVTSAAARALNRKDLPPPGFVLVGLAFTCAIAGAGLAIVQGFRELDVFWISLQRLLSYQGFVLLPILGISPFLVPRFFGRESPHDLPSALIPGPAWRRKATLALIAGAVLIASFVVEAAGWLRTAYAVRFLATLAYTLHELPLHRTPKGNTALGLALQIAFPGILFGFLAAALWPGYRVGLLHIALVGGFAVITLTVATRVVFGHCGRSELLERPNRWILVALSLMVLGMTTRISGDFWPKVMASHYTYGSLLWIAGVLFWSAIVLPKIRLVEDD